MKKALALVSSLLLVATLATPAQSAGAQFSVYQKTLAAFSSSATGLTSQQKAQVRAAVEANPTAEKFICTGIRYYDQPMSVNITVRKRAKAACDYAKQLNPALSTWFQNKPTQARSYAGKVLLTVKSPLPKSRVEPSAIEVCKIPDGRPTSQTGTPPGLRYKGDMGMSNVGFPYSRDRFSNMGPVNFIVAAVSFEDLPGAPTAVDDYLDEQTAKISEWGDFWSQGQVQYEFQVVEDWQELPFSSSRFAAKDVSRGGRTVSAHVGLADEIAKEIGTKVDWADADGLFVLFPVGYDGFTGDWNSRGDVVQTPSGSKSMFFWGGGEYHLTDAGGISLKTKQDHLWSYWIHEILHSQGSNLHAPGNGWAVGLGQNQYPTYQAKFSGAMNAWESFKKGWIFDEQVFCLDGREDFSDARTLLTPMEVSGGETKMAVVRTGQHTGLVVTSRRPTGYSADWAKSDSGITVYRLDLSLMNDRTGEGNVDCGNSPDFDKWAYYLAPDGKAGVENACRFEEFIIKAGQKVSYGGVEVKLSSSGSKDFIEISNRATLNSAVNRSGLGNSLSQVLGEAVPTARKMNSRSHCSCCGCTPSDQE